MQGIDFAQLREGGRALWRTLFWGCVAVVLYLSLAPVSPELPSTGWDKSNHLLAFVALSVLCLQAYSPQRAWPFMGLLLFGALIEGLQSLTSYRSAEWADWFADLLGVIAGLGLHQIGARYFARRSRRRAIGSIGDR